MLTDLFGLLTIAPFMAAIFSYVSGQPFVPLLIGATVAAIVFRIARLVFQKVVSNGTHKL